MPTLTSQELSVILKKNPAIRISKVQKKKADNSLSKAIAKKGPKYWNIKVFIYSDGYIAEGEPDPKHGLPAAVYDSRREYVRAVELARLERCGKITNLRRQKKIELEPKGEYMGQTIQAECYYADFVYEKDGVPVVEDVKAYSEGTGKFRTTELFRSKWNRLKRRYSDYLFVVIDPIAGQQKN